jgi:hypothetical protein
MAHLWVMCEAGDWNATELNGEAFSLTIVPPKALTERPADDLLVSEVVLLRTSVAGRVDWVLIAGTRARVSVNGILLSQGISVLNDRDEIRIEGPGKIFFSTETLARVEPFPGRAEKAAGGEEKVFCPRCRQAIEPETRAIRCPQCHIWHHQTDELPCWTYSATCAMCPQPTPLGATFSWTPEEL